ncbi:MAG: response regulator [Pseudobdellovibrio sp.]
MKKKLLLVEDDPMFSDILCDVLKTNYNISNVDSGKKAIEALTLTDFDIVVSDVQMPALSGIELLEWSKKNKPVPFIIMTGFSTLLETKSAFELGAAGFLTKPFKMEELTKLIDSILGNQDDPAKKKKAGLTSEDFCRINIEDFISKPVINHDLYIKLSETNFIKIANVNDELPKDKIQQYSKKGIKHLFILRSDFRKLVQLNLDLVKAVRNRNLITPAKKMALIKQTSNLILENIFTNGISKETLQDSADFMQIAVEEVIEHQEGSELLDFLSNQSNKVFSHSMSVALFSVLIAKKLKITSMLTLFKISLAGVFHDIGKKEIDPAILEKPRHLLTRDERSNLESHAVRGHDILVHIKNIHSDVTRLILEHHEDQVGTGYPRGKTARDQHPLSKILQMANIFVDHMQLAKDEAGDRPVSPNDVISHIEGIYENRIDKTCLGALKELFGSAHNQQQPEQK